MCLFTLFYATMWTLFSLGSRNALVFQPSSKSSNQQIMCFCATSLKWRIQTGGLSWISFNGPVTFNGPPGNQEVGVKLQVVIALDHIHDFLYELKVIWIEVQWEPLQSRVIFLWNVSENKWESVWCLRSFPQPCLCIQPKIWLVRGRAVLFRGINLAN